MTQDDKTSPPHGFQGPTLGRGLPPDPVQRMLDEVTHTPLPLVALRETAQGVGPLLGFLVRLTGARRIVAAETITEAAILPMAAALPPDGTLLTCDVSEERAERARVAGQQAGVADRIELRTGPVAETLRDLPDTPLYDLAYIAADRAGTTACWEALVPRIRQGGLLVVDHAFLHESDGPDGPDGPDAPDGLNGTGEPDRPGDEPVVDDERVDAVVLGLAAGLTLARKE
ncbi:O-methyltransferase [Streptomyces odontomachi]|uniref:O-methyltransferase n=1 Tax=Streptomyces odontomachi TaxID=2944940 RepID=UPI00210BB2B1|nr:class I SAM-dependent methyltransferase [Streptomyces sp. ODS25]